MASPQVNKILRVKVKACFRQSMTFFRGPDYAELEEEISSITEAKEEKQFDGAAKATEQSSILQTASKIASLKFIRPFSCIGVIYIIYELSGKYRM